MISCKTISAFLGILVVVVFILVLRQVEYTIQFEEEGNWQYVVKGKYFRGWQLGLLKYKWENWHVFLYGTYIMCPLGEFEFVCAEEVDAFSGWSKVPSNLKPESRPFSDSTITASEIERGFYEVTKRERKQKTPDSWVLVKCIQNEKYFWIDPSRGPCSRQLE